jgi:chromosomal replication initiator protein
MNDVKIDMWSNILKNIHRKIPNDSFITWFDNISLEEFSDSEITIGVPNKFVKTFIIEKFSEVLADAISANIGENKTVKYKVIPELRNKVENARLLGINLKDKKTIDSELILPIVNSNEKFTNTHQNQDFFPFDYSGLPLVQSYKLDNFVIGPSNRVAYSGIMSVLENPGVYNPVFLYGSSGLGKTHILHGLCHELIKKKPYSKIVFISCEEFINEFITHVKNGKMIEFRNKYRKIDTLIIDDIHFLGRGSKEKTQDEFLQTFDALYNSSCQIIVSSDAHPKDISSLQDKIQMRFISGLVAAMEPPDFVTRTKILYQKCKEKSYSFPKEVIEFIASNVTSNVRELGGALVKIHAQSSFIHQPISLELAQKVLDISSRTPKRQSRTTPIEVLSKISEFFDVEPEVLKVHKRGKNAIPRQLGMLVMRKSYTFSYQEICEVFGCKSHASVMHGEKIALKSIEKDGSTKIVYSKLMDHMQNKF